MKFRSRATGDFWRAYHALPADVQDRAMRSYALFQADPAHPSLIFKRVNNKVPVYSARVDRTYRALCRMDGDTVTWFLDRAPRRVHPAAHWVEPACRF